MSPPLFLFKACILITFWLSYWTTTASATNPPCSVCFKQGQVVTHPTAFIASEGKTCAQIDAEAQSGQYSPAQCGFVAGFVDQDCCGDATTTTMSTTAENNSNNNNNNSDNPSTPSTKCYDISSRTSTTIPRTGDTKDRLCVKDLGYLGLCSATVNGRECTSCRKDEFLFCQSDPMHTYAGSGFTLNCKFALHSMHEQKQLCDDGHGKVTLEEPFQHQFHSSTRRSNNSDDDDGILVWIALVLVIFFLKVFAATAKLSNRNRYRQAPTNNNDIELAVSDNRQASQRQQRGGGPQALVFHQPGQPDTIVFLHPTTPRGATQQQRASAVAVPMASAHPISQADEAGDIPLVPAVPVPANVPNNSQQQKSSSVNNTKLLIAQDPLALIIQNQAQIGSLDAFQSEINNYREGAWDMRARYIQLASESLNIHDGAFSWEELVKKAQQEQERNTAGESTSSRSPSAQQIVSALHILHGNYMIRRAWDARGTGWASTVTDNSRRIMKERLQSAKILLEKAARLDLSDPTPFAILQTVAMGLSGREAAEKWLERARSRDRFNYHALMKHGHLLMRKWHGRTVRESIEFLRRVTEQQAPSKDHPIRVILLCGLLNQYRDAAWKQSMRKKLLAEYWVTRTSLDIFMKVYKENPDPPLKTLLDKEIYQSVCQWLAILYLNGKISQEILQQARNLQCPTSSSRHGVEIST